MVLKPVDNCDCMPNPLYSRLWFDIYKESRQGFVLSSFYDNEVTYIQSLFHRSFNPFMTSDTMTLCYIHHVVLLPRKGGRGRSVGVTLRVTARGCIRTHYTYTYHAHTHTHTPIIHPRTHLHTHTHAHTHMHKQAHAWKFVETDSSSNVSPVLLFIRMLYFSTSTATLCGTSLIEPLEWYTGLTVSLQVVTLLDHRLTAGSHITRSPSHCSTM